MDKLKKCGLNSSLVSMFMTDSIIMFRTHKLFSKWQYREVVTKYGCWNQPFWAQVQVLPLSSSLTLGKHHHLLSFNSSPIKMG